MVVNREGGWYVSPLFTAGEYLSEARGTSRARAVTVDASVRSRLRRLASTVTAGESVELHFDPSDAFVVVAVHLSDAERPVARAGEFLHVQGWHAMRIRLSRHLATKSVQGKGIRPCRTG